MQTIHDILNVILMIFFMKKKRSKHVWLDFISHINIHTHFFYQLILLYHTYIIY